MFKHGFALIRDRLEHRLYPTVDDFTMDMVSMLNSKPEEPVLEWKINLPSYAPPVLLMSAETSRKDETLAPKTAERLLKQVKPLLEEAKKSERELENPSGDEVDMFAELKTGGIDEMEVDIGLVNGNGATTNGMVLDDNGHRKGNDPPV